MAGRKVRRGIQGLKLVRDHNRKKNQSPGAAVYVGVERPEPVEIDLLRYNETDFSENRNVAVADCRSADTAGGVKWVCVRGIHDPEKINELGSLFNLHPLVIEDVLNTHQRPKMEDFDDYLFVVIKTSRWDPAEQQLRMEQISLILLEGVVISFSEHGADALEPLRERLRTSKGRIRSMGADYLFYRILDTVVDHYFEVLEGLSETLEKLEDETISSPTGSTLERIYLLRRQRAMLLKSVWPVRELTGGLQRSESVLLTDSMAPFLRDLYDHAVQAVDIIETFREMLLGLLDTYLSSFSNRMNEVMKVLTIIATIFIPLTFVCGVYGMNFSNMPELQWKYGYLTTWGVMLVMALGMVIYFRWRRWF